MSKRQGLIQHIEHAAKPGKVAAVLEAGRQKRTATPPAQNIKGIAMWVLIILAVSATSASAQLTCKGLSHLFPRSGMSYLPDPPLKSCDSTVDPSEPNVVKSYESQFKKRINTLCNTQCMNEGPVAEAGSNMDQEGCIQNADTTIGFVCNCVDNSQTPTPLIVCQVNFDQTCQCADDKDD